MSADKTELVTISTFKKFREYGIFIDSIDSESLATTTELSDKQNTLTAGTGITIVGDVISATGATALGFSDLTGQPTDNTNLNNALTAKQDVLTAGTGISIANDVISATGTTSLGFSDLTGQPTDNTNLNNVLTAKQDVLTTGAGITISNNVISASGTTSLPFNEITGQPTDNANLSTALTAKQDVLTAGTGITIVDGTIGTTASTTPTNLGIVQYSSSGRITTNQLILQSDDADGKPINIHATSANGASHHIPDVPSTQFIMGTSTSGQTIGGPVSLSSFGSGILHSSTNGLLSSSSLTVADLPSDIPDSSLATISTAGKIDNSATTATSSSSPDTIVSRDAQGATEVITLNTQAVNLSLPSATNGFTLAPASAQPGAKRTYSMMDVGEDANFIMDNSSAGQTLGGNLSLSSLGSGFVRANASGLLSSSALVATDLPSNIPDSHLATISTAGKVANSATTATTSLTPNAIVQRDVNGKIDGTQLTNVVVDRVNANQYFVNDGVTSDPIYVIWTNNAHPTTTRHYALVDVGKDTSFMMTDSNAGQNIGGKITFTGDVNLNNISGDTVLTCGLTNKITGVAALDDSFLNTISTSGKVANSATTSTSSSSPDTIVLRDGTGATEVITLNTQAVNLTGPTFTNGFSIQPASSQPSAKRTYSMMDVGENANFLMDKSLTGQTLGGNLTMTALNEIGAVQTDANGLFSTGLLSTTKINKNWFQAAILTGSTDGDPVTFDSANITLSDNCTISLTSGNQNITLPEGVYFVSGQYNVVLPTTGTSKVTAFFGTSPINQSTLTIGTSGHPTCFVSFMLQVPSGGVTNFNITPQLQLTGGYLFITQVV